MGEPAPSALWTFVGVLIVAWAWFPRRAHRGRPAGTDGPAVHVDLRQSGHGLDYANQGDLDAVPSLDRRARLWLEIARGYAQRKDQMVTLAVLQRAIAISEESMRCHPISRSLAGIFREWRPAGRA